MRKIEMESSNSTIIAYLLNFAEFYKMLSNHHPHKVIWKFHLIKNMYVAGMCA